MGGLLLGMAGEWDHSFFSLETLGYIMHCGSVLLGTVGGRWGVGGDASQPQIDRQELRRGDDHCALGPVCGCCIV